jgi:hypothetical protein
VVERCGGAGLQLKTTKMIRIGARSGTDEFQGDIAFQAFITRSKNLAHSAGADFF